MAFAGVMAPTNLVPAQLHCPNRLLLAALVGVNLLQAAFAGFRPPVLMLRRLGARPGMAFD